MGHNETYQLDSETVGLITSAVESAIEKMDESQLRTLVTDAYVNVRP